MSDTLTKINSLTTPKVGEPATYSILGDAYPAVVVDVTKSGKTVWVRLVSAIHVRDDVAVGYGWEGTETILDPQDVDDAIRAGRDGARKAMRRTITSEIRNGLEEDQHGLPVGTKVEREVWSMPQGGHVRFGSAISKQDPHV